MRTMPPPKARLDASAGVAANRARDPPLKRKRGRPPKKSKDSAAVDVASDDSDNDAATQPDTPLVDYSDLQLAFENPKQAWESCSKRLATLDTAWTPPANDESLPKTNEDRKAHVRSLLGAMQDRNNCLDGTSTTFKNRWGPDRQLPYHVEDMEKVCWDIVVSGTITCEYIHDADRRQLLAERIHREGPQILSIFDTSNLLRIQRERNYTFKERIDSICRLLMSFKSRVDHLMKGDGLARLIAAPQSALLTGKSNSVANVRRAKWVAIGKEAQNEHEAEHSEPDDQGSKRARKAHRLPIPPSFSRNEEWQS
jgi:hypothetical protein